MHAYMHAYTHARTESPRAHRLKDIIDLLVRAKESQLVERDYNFAAKLIDMQMGVATGDLTLAEARHPPTRTLYG